MMRRRSLLKGIGCFGAGALLAPAWCQSTALPIAAATNVKIYIPANAGGGWDQTGRSLGQALASGGLVQQIEYTNNGGKGGTIGLADFVEKHSNDPSALLIGGMVMVGAIAVSRTPVTLQHVTPIARLTSDYMVLVVPADSPIKDMKALSAQIRRDLGSVLFTGGSAGGVDHMLAGMMGRSLRADPAGLKYLPTSSGPDAIAQLHAGRATVAISGYSELKAGIADKSLIPLAISSRHSLFGIPSLREQGIDTELDNWRGVFAPAKISDEQKQQLRQLVVRATETSMWKQTVADKGWLHATMHGKDFADSLEIEQAIANAVTLLLKLKA